MANMKSIVWDKHKFKELIEPVQGWASYVFFKDKEPLWSGFTPNLPTRLNHVVLKAEDSSIHAQLIDEADSLHYQCHAQAIDALIRHKIYLHKHNPQYQQLLHTWSDYAYLAVDPLRFPFVSVKSFTDEDWIYLGPWRSRFFLADVMDCLSRILRLPFCETGTFPCDKLESEICNGYCQALDETLPKEERPDLDKLDALLRQAYLHPNNGILEMVTQERDKYFDNLEFIKADLLNDEVENLKKYRDWLNFLYASKSLAFDTETLKVENGLIRSCLYDGKTYKFPAATTEYRENERLALNLQDVDEARVVYEYHLKLQQG